MAPKAAAAAEEKKEEAEEEPKVDPEVLRQTELKALEDNFASRRATMKTNRSPRTVDPKKLKSDLKKSSAVVKRFKTFTSDDLSGVLAAIRQINLTRYVSEIVQAIVTAVTDGKLRPADVAAAGEVCSILHQYYPEFGEDLAVSLSTSLDTSGLVAADAPQGAPSIGVVKVTSRLICEVFALGIHQEPKAILRTIKFLANPTPAGSRPPVGKFAVPSEKALGVLNLLLKYYSEELLGLRAASVAALLEAPDSVGSKEQAAAWANATLHQKEEGGALVPEALRGDAKGLLEGILEAGREGFDKLVEELEEMWRDNAKTISDKGELPEERKKLFQDTKSGIDKYRALLASLADVLGCPEKTPEELDMSRFTSGETNTSITFMCGLASYYAPVEEFGSVSLFDEEEQRAFYEDFLDISQCVPAWALDQRLRKSLLQGTKLPPGETPEDAEEGDEGGDDEPEAAAGEEGKKKGVSFTPETEEGAKGRPKRAKDQEGDEKKEGEKGGEKAEKRVPDFTAVDALLQQLYQRCGVGTDDWLAEFLGESYAPPGGSGQETPEEIAFTVRFAASCRKRLLTAMIKAPRTSLNLLPHFARISGTLAESFRDFGPNIGGAVEDEFDKLHERQNQIQIESRRRNIRFIGELVKAKVMQPAVVLRCFAQCLDNFVHHNIEVSCQMLEVCGRWLYRNQASSVRLQNLLQHMKRVQQQKALDQQYEAMIENALIEARPPELEKTKKAGKKHRVKTPLELFLRKLVYDELTEDQASIRKVVRIIRKLDWDDKGTAHMVAKILRKAHKIQVDRLPALATVIASIKKHRPEVSTRVVDMLLEQIRLALEVCPPIKDGAHHQPVKPQRRLLDLQFFTELYVFRIVDDHIVFDLLYAVLFYAGWNEAKDDYFRIRMLITLLEGVLPYSARLKQGRRKLCRFLPYFYLYVHRKAKPFPVDLDFSLAGLMEAVDRYAMDRGTKPYVSFPQTLVDAQALVDQLEKSLTAEERKRVRSSDPIGGRNFALYHFICNLRDAPGNPGAPIPEGGRKKHGLASNNVVPFRNKIHPVKTGIESDEEEDEDDEEDDEGAQATGDERRKTLEEEEEEKAAAADSAVKSPASAEATPASPQAEPEAETPVEPAGHFLVPGGALFSSLRNARKEKEQKKDDDDFMAMFAETMKESLSSAKHDTAMRQMKDGGKVRAEEKMNERMTMPVSAIKRAGDQERVKRAAGQQSTQDGMVPFTVVLRRKGQQTEEVSTAKLGGRTMALGTVHVPADAQVVAKQEGYRQQMEEASAEARRKIVQLAQQQQQEAAEDEMGVQRDIGPLHQQAAVPRTKGKGGGKGRGPQRTQTTLMQHRAQKQHEEKTVTQVF
eukprot:Hpha_TRINITY_DN25921_c0_g1::TRINITY_DN25921_c0_g1_i1::g.185388::m.185388/K14327/UPF2, RENT2; regulator of nonsense transcripts 2